MDFLTLAIAKKMAPGGGGNPNRVQTITGTVGSPFGAVDYDTLKAALANGNASALLLFNYLGTPVPLPLQGETFIYANAASLTISPNEYTAANVWWEDATTMNALMVSNLSGGVVFDAAQIVKDSESILTIIWHPLPGGDSDA